MVISKGSYGHGEFKKCIGLVGANTVLTSAGPQSNLFNWGVELGPDGNMPIFGPTNPHGTAFGQKQW